MFCDLKDKVAAWQDHALNGVRLRMELSQPAMGKSKKDPVREERIQNEIIVDAYGPEEQALGWYYSLENQITFPFRARCTASRVVSLL